MVFVDTSAWFALFLPTDPEHASVRRWIAENAEPLLTTDYCVDETLTLLLCRRERSRAMEAGEAFFQGDLCRLHHIAPEQVRRAWILFRRRAILADWSFTDCTSKIVIDDLGIRKAVSLDKHFHQFGRIVVAP